MYFTVKHISKHWWIAFHSTDESTKVCWNIYECLWFGLLWALLFIIWLFNTSGYYCVVAKYHQIFCYRL